MPEGEPRNIELNRGRVDAFKQKIQEKQIFSLDGEERNQAAKSVIGELGITGVDTLEGMYEKTRDSKVNQQAAEQNILDLGTAIGECIMESGDERLKEAVKAGSFSTEKLLPEAWQGDDKNGEGDTGLAQVITDSFLKKVGNSERRQKISTVMETVDYFKNNQEYLHLLPDQINSSIEELRKMINPLNRSEMQLISERMAYLQKLKDSFSSNKEDNQPERRRDYNHPQENGSQANGRERVVRGRIPRINPETGAVEGYDYDSEYQISYDNLVGGFQWMENRMTLRWNDYITQRWYKELPKHEQEKVSIAMMMSDVADGLKHAGKDLEAIMKNKEAFGFLSEHMSKLFDKDFKLVTSKMLNDLCTLYVDSNGKTSLKYKEDGTKIDSWVRYQLEHIHNYEDSLAGWLAEQNGRTEANNMDKLNAYTAWNMFFGLGDSSMADRLRSLPTWEGVISDALRTLNPEYKALAKWMVIKSGNEKSDKDLVGVEYFSSLSTALIDRMKMERDLGHPIDGEKTLRQKILDGDVSFLSHKMFYGFLDFFNGDRDLYVGSNPDGGKKFFDKGSEEGDNISASQLLMDYAFKDKRDERGNIVLDKNGKPEREFIGKDKIDERREFTFGNGQVTFMNEFRDSLEGATMAFYCLTGKVKIDSKDAKSWVTELKSKLGMVSDLRFSSIPAFTYARNPDFWRDILVSIYGADPRRISTDYIAIPRIKTTYCEKNNLNPENVSYSGNLLDLITNDLGINNNDIEINELLSLLGVKISPDENPSRVAGKNDRFEMSERMKTGRLLAERNKSMKYGEIRDIDPKNNEEFRNLVGQARSLRSDNPEFLILRKNFERMVTARSYKNAENIYREMLKITNSERK